MSTTEEENKLSEADKQFVAPTTGQIEPDSQAEIDNEDDYVPWEERPYEKRFTLSREQFARDRMDKLREALEKAQAERPEILGITLFGSMTKGTAKETSDIDGTIYIDTELLKDGANLIERKQETSEYDEEKVSVELNRDIEEVYMNYFRENLLDNNLMTEEQIEHLRARPINHELIDEQINYLIDYEHKKQKYVIGEGKEPQIYFFRNSIDDLFHLQMGKGIDKYRSYVIKKLQDLGDDGEIAWKEIVDGTYIMEDSSRKIRLPETLAEASKIYVK